MIDISILCFKRPEPAPPKPPRNRNYVPRRETLALFNQLPPVFLSRDWSELSGKSCQHSYQTLLYLKKMGCLSSEPIPGDRRGAHRYTKLIDNFDIDPATLKR